MSDVTAETFGVRGEPVLALLVDGFYVGLFDDARAATRWLCIGAATSGKSRSVRALASTDADEGADVEVTTQEEEPRTVHVVVERAADVRLPRRPVRARVWAGDIVLTALTIT